VAAVVLALTLATSAPMHPGHPTVHVSLRLRSDISASAEGGIGLFVLQRKEHCSMWAKKNEHATQLHWQAHGADACKANGVLLASAGPHWQQSPSLIAFKSSSF
ncbi:hypothetical protein LZT27_22285, partial [Aeromonas veronii]|uniref:hypothetical protein n=1 Tax=Aeromonas veronii TaxID=654 RepID=UPI0023649775